MKGRGRGGDAVPPLGAGLSRGRGDATKYFNTIQIVRCVPLDMMTLAGSIDLDDAVDLGDKPEAGEEADGSCEQEEQEDHDEGVAEVEEGAGDTLDLQLRHVVVDAVEEEVDRREATR